MVTIERDMRRAGPWLDGVAPLRFGLVVALFAYQSLEVSASFGRVANSPIWILPATLVPALLALTGFLLAQSLEHGGRRGFLLRRFLRGWPVLACTVAVSALVIGPLATGASFADYIRDPGLALYFLNLVAIPVERLPDVFTGNYLATANDILWASPYVVAGVAILSVASLSPSRMALIVATALAVMAAAALAAQLFGNGAAGDLAVIGPARAGRGLTALSCFLLGALAVRLPSWLKVNWIVALVAALVIAAAAVLGERGWGDVAVFNILIALPLTYLVVAAALSPLPLAEPAAAVQKYLSGVVLFAYPSQQLVVASRLIGDGFPAVFIVSVPVTVVFAVLAWHLVQRRFFVLSGGIEDREASRDDLGRRPSLEQLWQQGLEMVPELSLWALFFLIAMSTIALTVVAFLPESGGI